MRPRHRLLQRQIRKHLRGATEFTPEMQRFLDAVGEAYEHFDLDRKLVARSMDLSSSELTDANALIHKSHIRDETIMESLRVMAKTLRLAKLPSLDQQPEDLIRLSQLIRQQVHLRAEAEARAFELAAMLDIANDAIYVCGMDGRVLYWNGGAERLYGWGRSEAVNRPITDLFPNALEVSESERRTLLAEGTHSSDLSLVTRGGQGVSVHCRITLVRDEAGEPKSLFVIHTDISERKRLEERFLRAQRLESVGVLASGLAHDLNNILVPVIVGAQLVKEVVTDPEALESLREIEICARRGADIVKQVLAFARGTDGERVPLRPDRMIREVATIAGNTFPKNIQIRTDVQFGVWTLVGDATQIHQALMNLCINARDALAQGGTITIGASNGGRGTAGGSPPANATEVTLLEPRPGPSVCLWVSDTGTGIPRSVIEKIFEPFFTTKGIGKGTGLGLSTVLGIVRGHQGHLRVSSAPGVGSTFELHFPAHPEALVEEATGIDLEILRGHGETILLVDDEQSVRTIVGRILERFGYRLVAFPTADEAVRHFAANHASIDAVITDFAMPGMDGPAVVAALRKVDPAVRIMGMSGHKNAVGPDVASPWAVHLFLSKPFTTEQVLVSLHRLLHPTGRTQAPFVVG